MTARFDPLGILSDTKTQPVQATNQEQTVVTSRMSNDRVGVCPVCSTAMARIMAKDIPVYWCQAHGVVLPVED